MTKGFIYCITNTINGKQYIGQTIQNPNTRWLQHQNAAKHNTHNYLLYRAMNKYGTENFTFEVIIECDQEELNNKEKEYIKKYNTYFYFPNSNGYNLTLGGEGCATRDFNELEIVEKYKIKQSIEKLALEYDCSLWTISNILNKHNIQRTQISYKFTNEEVKDIIKDYQLCKSTQIVANKYQCSVDTITKILKKNKIPVNGIGRSRKVYIVELNLAFDSLMQAAIFLIDNKYTTNKAESVVTMLSRQLSGKRKSKTIFGLTFSDINTEI